MADSDERRYPDQQGGVRLMGTHPLSDLEDFNDEECLCQMKVVPPEKRIDFIELVDGKDGKRKWTPVLRYHKDCPFHGIKVTNAERT